jgi:hypothetical protein
MEGYNGDTLSLSFQHVYKWRCLSLHGVYLALSFALKSYPASKLNFDGYVVHVRPWRQGVPGSDRVLYWPMYNALSALLPFSAAGYFLEVETES